MDIPFDVTGIRIETERLVLRPFEETDLADFFAYASIPEVGEAAGWPHHKSIEDSRIILNDFFEKKEVLAMYHKADKRVIGSIGLHLSWTSKNESYKHLPAKEVGYVLSKDYWGQSLTAEGVKAVIEYGFNHLGLECFGLAHSPENIQSRRVAEKCGFVYSETGQFFSKLRQVHIDDIRHILLRKSWK